MVFLHKPYFVLLESITFVMPFLVLFCFGKGSASVWLMFALWGCLFVASCFQLRFNRALACSGFVVWIITFLVMVWLPGYFAIGRRLGKW